ncbi:hypothetical protein K3Z96_30030, partial [Pseudomonas aeruginosa]|nr:hypothetical protein [Pseudomonas aeruginosa]
LVVALLEVFTGVGATGLLAVLTVVGPASIFQAEEQGPAAERLLATTRAISWRMGYDGTQGG